MKKEKLDEKLCKLYEGHGMADTSGSVTIENADEYYKNNDYITIEEFGDRVTKLV